MPKSRILKNNIGFFMFYGFCMGLHTWKQFFMNFGSNLHTNINNYDPWVSDSGTQTGSVQKSLICRMDFESVYMQFENTTTKTTYGCGYVFTYQQLYFQKMCFKTKHIFMLTWDCIPKCMN